MKKSDRVFSIICIGLSLWLILESLKYDFLEKYTPGPGFMPFWLGVVLLIFSIALLIETFVKKNGKEVKKRLLPPRHSLYRLGLIMLITAGFSLVMNFLGFTLSVILYVPVILFFMEGINITKSVIAGLAFGVCIFLIFQYWMEVNLPTGFWGF